MAAINPFELSRRTGEEPALVVVDVRDAREFAGAHISGAWSRPLDEALASRLAAEIGDRGRPVVFVCAWGHRSAIASIALQREGFRNVSYLDGGLESWGRAALPVVRTAEGASAP